MEPGQNTVKHRHNRLTKRTLSYSVPLQSKRVSQHLLYQLDTMYFVITHSHLVRMLRPKRTNGITYNGPTGVPSSLHVHMDGSHRGSNLRMTTAGTVYCDIHSGARVISSTPVVTPNATRSLA